MSTAEGRRTLVATLAAAAFGLLALTAAPASAHVIHNLESSFPVQATGGPQGNPAGDAFDASSGKLWVLDATNQTVDEFAPDGTYQNLQLTGPQTPAGSFGFQFFNGVAVDNSAGPNAGDVYVADWGNAVVDRFDSAGNYLCQITGKASASATECNGASGSQTPQSGIGPSGLTVDQSGNLWVSDLANAALDEFGPSGDYITQIQDPNIQNPTEIGLDSAGNLYATNFGSDVVKFTGGAFAGVLDANAPIGLATDPGSDRVYASDSSPTQFTEYDTQGNQLSAFPAQSGQVLGGAIRPSTGELYANDFNNGQIDLYSGDLVVPDVTTGQATNVTQTTATLTGTVNPADTTLSDCHFDYGTDTSYGQTAPCSTTPSGSMPVPLSADLTGLTSDTLYHFQLEATNGNGTVTGGDQTFYTHTVPVIDFSVPSSVGVTTAELKARINPESLATSYHVEYGTSSSYGQSTSESASIGSGISDVSITQQLSGLQANTTYHFRFVATNGDGPTDGPDGTFTTYPAPPGLDTCPNAQVRSGPSASLPDCRAYELVSPPGVQAAVGGAYKTQFWQAAADGNGVVYQSPTGFGDSQSGMYDYYLATRSASGWSTDALLPPQATDNKSDNIWGPVFFSFSPDLGHGVLIDGGGSTFNYGQDSPPIVAGEPANVPNLFLRDNRSNTYQLLTTSLPPGGAEPQPSFVGASTDYGHVVFGDNAALTPSAPSGVGNFYEWVGGALRLASVLPDGTPAPQGVGGSCQANPVSADGSRILWTNAADSQLYVRENATSTVQASASQKSNGAGPGGTDPYGPGAPIFTLMSADGSKVIFQDSEELTNDANTGSSDSGSDLYSYDVATGQLTDLTVDTNPADAGGANVSGGVIGASADGSYVYFVAYGDLAPGATSGQPNLYLWHGGTTTLVATLSPDDSGDWFNCAGADNVRITPDGRHIAFQSDRSLTGYDNTDAGTGAPDTEIYLYDAAAGKLTCPTCNPSGVRPTDSATFGTPPSFWVYNGTSPASQPRNLSDMGTRLFFQTSDRLLPAAANSKQNVFEWEAGGEGGCQSARCLYLISSGGDGSDALLQGVSASGNDVFFLSHAELAPQDTSDALAMYDARVGGGLPLASTPAPCVGDACKGQPAGAPMPPTAASVSFHGPGNATSGGSSATVRVLTRTVHRASFLIRVRVPGPGRIAISGARIGTVRKVVSSAGTYRLRVTLTPAGKRELAHGHGLRLRVRVSYTPAGGSTSVAMVSIRVKPALRRARRATTRKPRGAR